MHYEPLKPQDLKEQCASFDVLGDNQDLFEQCIKSGVWDEPATDRNNYANLLMNDQCDSCVANVAGAIASVRVGLPPQQLDTQHHDKVIGCIGNGMSQAKICQLMGDCEAKPTIGDRPLLGGDECVSSPEVVCSDLYLAKRCNRFDLCMRHHWKSPLSGSPAAIVEGDFECDECIAAFDEIKAALANNSTRQELIEKTEAICSRFLSADTCKQYIEAYLPEMIDMIENDVTSKQVCTLSGMCKQQQSGSPPIFTPVRPVRPAGPKPQGLLGGNECTQQLLVVCQSVQTAKKCGRFDMCLNNVWTMPAQQQTVLNNVPERDYLPVACDACRGLMEVIKAAIAREATLEQITEDAEKLCNHCPNKTECQDFIKEYLPEIIRLVDAGLNSEVICGLLGMCGPAEIAARSNDFLLLNVPSSNALNDNEEKPRPRARRSADYGGDYGDYGDYDDYEHPLFKFGSLLVQKLQEYATKGACMTCKLTMKRMRENDVSDMPEPQDIQAYIMENRDAMCNWVSDEQCPEPEEFREWVTAGEFLPEEECPVEGLCDTYAHETPITQHLNEILCTAYKKIFDTMSSDESWEELKESVKSSTEGKPVVQALLLNALEDAKQSENPLTASLSPKQQLELEVERENLIGSDDCDVFASIREWIDYEGDDYDYYK